MDIEALEMGKGAARALTPREMSPHDGYEALRRLGELTGVTTLDSNSNVMLPLSASAG